jgi:hypothetical protein
MVISVVVAVAFIDLLTIVRDLLQRLNEIIDDRVHVRYLLVLTSGPAVTDHRSEAVEIHIVRELAQ